MPETSVTKQQITAFFVVGQTYQCENSKFAHLCGPRKLLRVGNGAMEWELPIGKRSTMNVPRVDEIHELTDTKLKCALGPITGHTLSFTKQ